jgi:hypothetical protein
MKALGVFPRLFLFGEWSKGANLAGIFIGCLGAPGWDGG